mmetsp:Transcript_6205/g.21810  ORF Transcript_6205/g.21810 Transcript_6205/m.21810 type:complete len:267 (+) Transcript_6205:90-890(+)
MAKKGRKGKKAPLVGPGMRSMKRARAVTSGFHAATRELAAAESSGDAAGAARARGAIAALGGRDAYQQASILTTARHRTAKWAFAQLTALGMRPGRGEPPLRTLEVGAVNTQLLSVPWLDVRAVDLRSQHPRIEQADFFHLAPGGEFRVVVSSMVLNCVPGAAQRGRMLQLTRAHLQPNGVLFLMLPLRCLTRSPTCTWGRLESVLGAVGLEVLATKESPKVAFVCARAAEPPPRAEVPHELYAPPQEIAPGAGTDTFAVQLPDEP